MSHVLDKENKLRKQWKQNALDATTKHLLSETDATRTFCGRGRFRKNLTRDLYTTHSTHEVSCGDCVMALNWVEDGGIWKHAKPNSKLRRKK